MKRSFFTTLIKINSVVILILLIAVSLKAAENPFLIPEVGSASYAQGPFSSNMNPALSDLPDESPLLSYRFLKWDNEEKSNHLLLLNILGLSFTYGWYDHVYNSTVGDVEHAGANYFNINKGFMFNNYFGFGAGYSFSQSDTKAYDNYGAWSLGFLLRPWNFLSLGIALNDLSGSMGGSSIKRKEVYSISVRPFTDRLNLSMDATRLAGQGIGDMNLAFSTDIRLVYDISLFFRSDLDANMKFGITIPFFTRSARRPMGSSGIFDFYRSANSGDIAEYNSFSLTIPFTQYKNALSLTPDDTLLKISLNRNINELESEGLFTEKKITFLEIIEGIEVAAQDGTISGIILEIDDAGMGFAQIQEMRQSLQRFKETGKKVYAVMNVPGNKEYYLATAADKIYFTPNSTFEITGLSAEVYFFKNLLAKIGVKFEVVKHGEYKSAYESFNREHMSDQARENLVSLIKDLNDQFISDIRKDRDIPDEKITGLFAAGLMSPDEAEQAGFIDEVMYYDEALKNISGSLAVVRLGDYLGESEKSYIWGPIPAIAVLYIDGSIVRGKSTRSMFASTIGDATYHEMIEKAFKDSNVKAVVVRVSSGGGSAAASDYMLNDLMKYKKKYPKPVVFSFGNVAASGGYYVACSGDRIFASGGTITGSIGVITGKVSMKELYEKLGINKDTIKMSEFADIFSESKDLSDREREVVQKGVDFIYDRFTGKVVEARNITDTDIGNKAEGRVFSGTQGRENNLVDEMGGLVAAIEFARSEAHIDDNFSLMILPDEDTVLKGMLASDEMKSLTQYLRPLMKHLEPVQYGNERALYLLPYTIEIK
jgi:protease-4